MPCLQIEEAKMLQKSFRHQLSKIKVPKSHIKFQLRSCRHPRTPSLALDSSGKQNEDDDAAATLSDIDQFLFENFRSLYQTEYEEEMSKEAIISSPEFVDPPPLENLRGSPRFFVPSESSSSLIADEGCSSSNSSEPVEDNSNHSTDDFIALLTYSPCPYDDFRKSMQEMVDARLDQRGKVDWQFMEELLFCYMDLNNKKSHRFILRAFVDLMVVLRENSGVNQLGRDV